MTKKVHPLQNSKFYKVKNPVRNFLCALCDSPRSLRYKKHLSAYHFVQILVLSLALMWFSHPLFGEKVFFIPFITWLGFEFVNKLLYRKGIPCPYCGFDATWYRRDVKLAREKVKEYWELNYPDLVKKEDLSIQNNNTNVEPESSAPDQDSIN